MADNVYTQACFLKEKCLNTYACPGLQWRLRTQEAGMNKVNVQSLGGRLKAALHCDRLYDVLLAKAYPREYSQPDLGSLPQDEFPITLTVECNSRGVVTEMRVLKPAGPGRRD